MDGTAMRIIELYNEGLGCRRISALVNKSKSAIHEILVKNNIARRKPYGGVINRNRKVGNKYKVQGYVVVILALDDFFYPTARQKTGHIYEHRLIMAKYLGRNIHSWEIVHHKNHVRDDNRIENLQLVSDDRHIQITILERKIQKLEEQIKALKAQIKK
jgi:hypothetical protein